jgi:hypothetical protein
MPRCNTPIRATLLLNAFGSRARIQMIVRMIVQMRRDRPAPSVSVLSCIAELVKLANLSGL